MVAKLRFQGCNLPLFGRQGRGHFFHALALGSFLVVMVAVAVVAVIAGWW
jgi:hypothetical protein